MKLTNYFFGVIIFTLFLTPIKSYTQTAKGFNYQAIARNTDGEILAETEISVVLSILDISGEQVWEETHNITTSTLGLFNIAIGTNSEVVTNQSVENLSDLDWGSNSYQLKVIVNDTDMGTNPIMSVPTAFYGRDEDADPLNEIQKLYFEDELLTITGSDESIDLGTFVNSKNPWIEKNGALFYTNGKIGVGTISPTGVMDVVGAEDQIDTLPIFQVKNKLGIPIFSVYNEGVRILFPNDVSTSKGAKGGFAVGGYNTNKATETSSFLKVMPHGANINFFTNSDAKNDSKGTKGGFAVGGYNTGKGIESSYIYMDSYAVPATYEGGTIHLPTFDALFEKGNCYMGTLSGQNHEGHFNTSIGYQAGYNVTAGLVGYPILIANTASYNTFLGSFSGYSTDYGDQNVYLGYEAGFNNTGSGNVFIGYEAGAALTSASNLLFIDNENTNAPLIYGDFDENMLQVNGAFRINNGSLGIANNPGSSPTYFAYQGDAGSTNKATAFTINDYLWVTRGAEFDGNIKVNSTTYSSDKRYKKDISPIANGLQMVKKLNGVYYNWKKEEFKSKGFDNARQIGLIAQDVEPVLPEVVQTNDDGYMSIDYAKLTAVLIEAIKEQQELIDNQQKEIDALKDNSSAEMLMLIKDMQLTIENLSNKVSSMERYTEKQ